MKTRNTPRLDALLENLSEADRAVTSMEARLENLRMMTTDTAFHLSDMPRAFSPDPQKLETVVANMLLIEQQLILAKEKAAQIRQLLTDMASNLTDEKQQAAFYYHGILHNSLHQVSDRMKYSMAHIKRLYASALQALEKMPVTTKKDEPGMSQA